MFRGFCNRGLSWCRNSSRFILCLIFGSFPKFWFSWFLRHNCLMNNWIDRWGHWNWLWPAPTNFVLPVPLSPYFLNMFCCLSFGFFLIYKILFLCNLPKRSCTFFPWTKLREVPVPHSHCSSFARGNCFVV